MVAFTLNDVYFSGVEQKLALARQLFQDYGQELSALPVIKDKLLKLELLSRTLQQQMATMSMPVLCKACAEKTEGGCCSAYMANETDAFLLLLNMLLGVEVIPQRDDSFECCYLGSQGCILFVKPIFCLNYNCHHIMTGNTAAELKNLENTASAVLLEQTAVETIFVARLLNKNIT